MAQTRSPSMHIGGDVMGHPSGVFVLGHASGEQEHVGGMGHPSGPKSTGHMVSPSGHSGWQKLGQIFPFGPVTEENKFNKWASSIMLFVPEGWWSQPHRELWRGLVSGNLPKFLMR